MLSSLQRFLCKLVVGLIGSSDDDQLELVVLQDVVQSCVHGSSDAEPFLEFSPLGFRVPFQDSVQGEEFWEGKDEWYVEGEAS